MRRPLRFLLVAPMLLLFAACAAKTPGAGPADSGPLVGATCSGDVDCPAGWTCGFDFIAGALPDCVGRGRCMIPPSEPCTVGPACGCDGQPAQCLVVGSRAGNFTASSRVAYAGPCLGDAGPKDAGAAVECTSSLDCRGLACVNGRCVAAPGEGGVVVGGCPSGCKSFGAADPCAEICRCPSGATIPPTCTLTSSQDGGEGYYCCG